MPNPPQGGGTPLDKPDRYVPPNGVGICAALVLKRVENFPIWNLESGTCTVSKELRECTNVFFVSISNEKKEREICEFQFCCCSNLRNDDIILKGQVWKRVCRSEIGSGLGESDGTPPPRILYRTPRGPRPGYQDTSNFLPYIKITSASSYKDVSLVTSECVIEPNEKVTQTRAKRKRRQSIWAALVREKHENAILSTEFKTILY